MASNKMLLAFVGLSVLSLSVAPTAEGKHHEKESPLASIVHGIVGIVVETVFSPEQVGAIFQRLPQDKLVSFIKQQKPGVLSAAIGAAGADAKKKEVDGLSDEDLREIFGDKFEDIKNLSPEELLKTVQNLSPEQLAVFALKDPAGGLGAVLQAIPADDLGKLVVENLEDFLNVLKPTDIKAFVRAIVKYFTGNL